MPDLSDQFDQALAHWRAGRHDAAATACRSILRRWPRQADCLHLLAVLDLERGRYDSALTHAAAAVDADDQNASFVLTLGRAHKALGRLDDAVAAYRRALALEPGLVQAMVNLCNALRERGDLEEAISWGRLAVGVISKQAGQAGAGAAYNNLGVALRAGGRAAEAVAALTRAVELDPRNASTLTNLGNALLDQSDSAGAARCFTRAMELDPKLSAPRLGLGNALVHQERIDEAMLTLRAAAELDPQDAAAPLGLINLMRDQGLVTLVRSAVDGLRKLLTLEPDNDDLRRNLLFTLNYDPDADPRQVFEEHVRWGDRHTRLSAGVVHRNPRNTNPRNDPDPNRRLRLAYVSPDFRNHAVSYFLLPILSHHDPHRVEVFCYAQVDKPDHLTRRYQELGHHWRSTVGLSDEALAEMIRADGIDIAIDLAGHTLGNRLLALARRPAPVQVLYLGYPNTTGLRAFDYRLTDAVADPLDAPTPHVEELIRLPRGLSCYGPPADAPEVNPLPAATTGGVTFGALSNPAKINHRVIELWCRVLHETPGSRLLVARQTVKGQFLDSFVANFQRHGVGRDRLLLRSTIAPGKKPIHAYHDIDIALDTFPYSGHTTVCESLWLGVPMVTLTGRVQASRVGASVLTQAGCEPWIAATPEHFVSIAATLASDLDELARTRATLRQRVAASALCNAPAFVRSLEEVYRDLWARWCASQATIAA